jgi:hypothetical protein
MATQRQEIGLLQDLNRHEILRLRGYAFRLGAQGGVTVERWGHVRGVWRFENGQFAWTPTSHGEPLHNAEDAAAAVRYTLVALSMI